MGRRAPRGLFFSPALAAMVVAAACGTADNRVDPGDLELRDLLGISPQPASQWDGGERLAARRVIAQRLDDELPERRVASEPLAPFRDDVARDAVVIAALARWDERAAAEGWPARVLLRVAAPPGMLRATLHATSRTREVVSGRAPAASGATNAAAVGAEGDLALELAPAWNDEPLIELTSRGAAELTALARDAGHAAGPLVAVPAPRLAVLAAYLEPSRAGATPRLLVNPVLLAALEPGSGEPLDGALGARSEEGSSEGSTETAQHDAGGPGGGASPGGANSGGGTGAMAVGGNPYSFYGSVAECAYAQRLRCEACLPNGSCEPITNISDGNAECEMLGASSGRGYFLQCINLSLAISSVDECTADRAPSCPRDRDAASSLTGLETNARFLDEDGCKVGLDACLAKIYGAPEIEYPGPGGGGGGEPPPPPRDINVDCDSSCDDNDNNGNCESSPSCESSGPSCNNSLSCDSTCSNSNDQSGCNGNCNSCNSENSGGDQSGCGGECSDSDGGGGGGGDDSGCSSDDSGGGDGGGCGGDSGNSNDGCSGDGCNGDNDCGGGSGSGGSSCGGDSSGDSSCGGGGGGGCGGGSGDSGCGGSGGGSSSSKCAVTPNVLPSKSGRVPPGLSFLMMVLWGLAPIPAAALARRRALRKGRTTGPLEQGDGDGESRAGSGEAGAARDAAPAASGDRVSKEAPDRESPDRESDPESGDRESEPRTTPASGSEGGAR